MSHKYADIIIDISHEAIDRVFQYKIPDELQSRIRVGMKVSIPFGVWNSIRNGYVVALSDQADFDEDKIKYIKDICNESVEIEGSLIELADFMKQRYGSTTIQALKTVIPIKEKIKSLVRKEVRLLVSKSDAEQLRINYKKKNAKGKVRLLTELMEEKVIPYTLVTGKLNIATSTLKALQEDQVISIDEEGYYRDVIGKNSEMLEEERAFITPNDQQLKIIHEIMQDYDAGKRNTYLLKGVTGSGKTLVYIEVIERIIKQGKQAIVLIPEIALTYQTVKRFRQRFGNQVTIMNSKLSKGEKYDQFQKAKNGEVSVIIGPRSALFAPFPNLGIIVMDEEHETTYKSEVPPKYHAKEVAIQRAKMEDAFVLLGSATPSVDSYYQAMQGKYKLLNLQQRAVNDATMAQVFVADMREELKRGNRTIFSEVLQNKMREAFENKHQIMLFLNRRGYAGFISCRSCGYVFKCPHCDVSLTEHGFHKTEGKLSCHYCGYEIKKPQQCPICKSSMIASFGLGTEKVETMVKKLFPDAKVLRMDADTTKKKGAHEKILSQFSNGEADVLVGTQMIVKGHDFSNVTLVGVVAADLTLFENDYQSAEKTFDLLTQAAGRAGRGAISGSVVIQTYVPDHYSVESAAAQDYESFYEEEKAFRKLLDYPPFTNVLAIYMEHSDYTCLKNFSEDIHKEIGKYDIQKVCRIIGPCDATIRKVNDKYRRLIYVKNKNYDTLIEIKNNIEFFMKENECFKNGYVSFDFNPTHSY